MATLKLIILPNKALKNGKHKVRIAISHKTNTAYIVQNITIDSLSQFKDGQIANRPDAGILNRKLRTKLNEYQDILDKINTDNYTAIQIKNLLVRNYKAGSMSISEVANGHIGAMRSGNTKESYTRTLKYIIKACGDIPVEMLNHSIITKFEEYLRVDRRLNSTSCALHLRQFKAFVMPYIRRGEVSFDIQPFSNLVMPESMERQLDITIEEFKLIRDADFKERHFCVARDLFCLSYYLGGINMIDLMQINFKNTDILEYVREKSKNTKRGNKIVSLTIQPEAREIIDRWMDRNGKLNFGYQYSYDNFRKYVTAQIRRLAKEVGIDKRVVYYSARKSLVQHGFELGIDLTILEYSIGHSVKNNSSRPIFNYIRFMRSHADKAMRQILDQLK